MNNEQFNYQLITDYNRTFGTKLCPESNYPIATLIAMRKKLTERGIYGYSAKYKQSFALCLD